VSTPTKTARRAETAAAKAPTPATRFSSNRSVLLQRTCACGGGSTGAGAGAACESCRKKEAEEQKKAHEQKLQKSSSGPSRSATAPPVVNQVLNSPGRALDASTRSFMEPRFGRDFSGVRVHTDSRAAESARAVDAHAYTVGQHIVFDRGKYDPESRGGRQLLAHELAHTVQQHGLQRSSNDLSLAETSEYRHLEREADSVARSVTGGVGAEPTLTSRPTQALISRAKKDGGDTTAASSSPGEDTGERSWKDIDQEPALKAASDALKNAGAKQVALPSEGISGVLAFQMGKLKLPPDKGPVEKVWQDAADRKALQAIVDISGEARSTKLGLKQERPGTDQLKQLWLQKVKWKTGDNKAIEDKWKKITTPEDSLLKSATAHKSPCQVDHILELQFGGNNVPENMQMLDGPENMRSGRDIFKELKERALDIRIALKAVNQQASDVILAYDGIVPSSPTCKACCEAEKLAPAQGDVGAGESVAGQKGVEYPIYAGGPPAKLLITSEYASSESMPIRGSAVPENKSAATIVPGFLLETLHRPKKKGGDTISAIFDTEGNTKTRIPVTLDGEKGVDFKVAADGKLSLATANKNIKFHYPYLSAGTFTKLELRDDGSVSGTGTIHSSIPFLPQLHVKFDKESFSLIAPLDAKKLKPPIPGAKITEGEIGLQLAPQFKPYGMLAFELVTGPKKILDGKIDVTGDAQGLVATGVVHVFLPGVDNAEGNVKYQNGEWTGGVKIESTQMQSKLKYVKSGSVVVGLSSKGVTAEGKVGLDIPGTSGVDVSLLYEKHKWIFRGKGAFTPPKLKPVEIEIEYDGDHITGSAETGFEFHGLAGRLRVQYRDEKFSGEGTINIKKGRAEGKLHIKMRQEKGEPKFSGEGEVTYQITDNLVGTAGIEVNEQEEVRLKGALTFPKPIHLFDPIKGDYKIFEVGVSIPIPGASIGPVGLNARIDGALSAGYQIGPGELRNAKIEAAFNPLEEKPDLDLLMGAQLYIGARAYISGSISGGIEVSIGIASVEGGLTITATASLEGHVASEVKIHYQKSRVELDANFEVLLALALTLALDAFVKAKAGVGPFSVETKKVWNLASFKFDTGMQLGMKLKNPIHYASDQPFKFPSLDDIQWIKPDIDPKKVLERAFASGSSKEEEAGK
jgi:hypothetical protein